MSEDTNFQEVSRSERMLIISAAQKGLRPKTACSAKSSSVTRVRPKFKTTLTSPMKYKPSRQTLFSSPKRAPCATESYYCGRKEAQSWTSGGKHFSLLNRFPEQRIVDSGSHSLGPDKFAPLENSRGLLEDMYFQF